MTDDLNYRDYACRTPPTKLWRVQSGHGRGEFGDSHTVVRDGAIVSGWRIGQSDQPADFANIRDFSQAVKFHWNWNCRHRGGSRFISTFNDAGSARNWIKKMRRDFADGESSRVTIYEIDTSRLGDTPIFSSTYLNTVFNADFKYHYGEFLVLDRIPRECIVAAYMNFSVLVERARYLDGKAHLQ